MPKNRYVPEGLILRRVDVYRRFCRACPYMYQEPSMKYDNPKKPNPPVIRLSVCACGKANFPTEGYRFITHLDKDRSPYIFDPDDSIFEVPEECPFRLEMLMLS